MGRAATRWAVVATALAIGCGDGTGPARPPDIVFALVHSPTAIQSDLYLTNHRARTSEPLTELPDEETARAWSPDGQQVVFARQQDGVNGNRYSLWIVNVDGSGLRRLETGPGESREPAWSPDGSRIAFIRQVDGYTWGVAVVNVDGTGLRWVVGTRDAATSDIVVVSNPPTWSPDGTKLAFARWVPDAVLGWRSEIWSVSPDGTGLTRLIEGPFAFDPAWSPDGTRIAFSRSNGVDEMALMVALIDGSAVAQLTSGFRDRSPTWSPDGAQLAFARHTPPNRHIHVISATGGESTNITGYASFADRPAWRPAGGP